MKKVLALFISVLLILGIFAMPTFAESKALTAEKYKELKAAADFVQTFNHGIKLNFVSDLLVYIGKAEPKLVTGKSDYGVTSASIPAKRIKDIFYKAFSIENADDYYIPVVSPKGFFESDILPFLKNGDNAYGGFYNSEKDTYDIWDPAMGGGEYTVLNGYVDNKNNTYSFYYSVYGDYGEYEAGSKPDNVVITLKSAKDGITLVSDKKASKLPSKYSTVSYSITYKLNKGKNNGKNPKSFDSNTVVKLQKPTRKGYSFKGWYSDAKFKNKVTKIEKGTEENITLYAKWSKNTYTITYKLNKGKNNAKNPKKYTVTTSTIKFKNPTRKGYTFKGWYKGSKKITQIKKGSAGNITLTAKWAKKK